MTEDYLGQYTEVTNIDCPRCTHTKLFKKKGDKELHCFNCEHNDVLITYLG